MFDTKPENVSPPSITVGRVRRDGKIPVKFNFPLSGRTINKLLTPEKLEAALADANENTVVRYLAP